MIFRLSIYLSVGAFCHLMFVGSHFDWSSALTWLWLFGWPLMFLLWMGAIAVVVALALLAGFGAVRLVSR